MTSLSVDQLLSCSTTAYALAYLDQIAGVDMMSRADVIRNIDALYGFDDLPSGTVGIRFLRAELRDQINRDWAYPADPALWTEIARWKIRFDKIEANNDAEYGHEWHLTETRVDTLREEYERAITRAQQPAAPLAEDAPDRGSAAPDFTPNYDAVDAAPV